MQMRLASYMGKLVTHDLLAASAAEVFEAARVAPTRLLRRIRLRGRIQAGSL